MGANMSGFGWGLGGIVIGGVGGAYAGYKIGAIIARQVGAPPMTFGIIGAFIVGQWGIGFGPKIALEMGMRI